MAFLIKKFIMIYIYSIYFVIILIDTSASLVLFDSHKVRAIYSLTNELKGYFNISFFCVVTCDLISKDVQVNRTFDMVGETYGLGEFWKTWQELGLILCVPSKALSH